MDESTLSNVKRQCSQDEIRRTKEYRYDHWLHGLLLVAQA
jgi:hypothetical protein